MSADVGVDPAAPNLNLGPEEKRVYGQLFRQADTDNAGVVTGEVAVKFFDKTRLDSRILGEIWQIADRENRGFLTPAGFGIVLRLIAHAQAGREPTPLLALQQGPLPRFDGFFTPTTGSVASPPPPAAAIQSQGTGGVRVPPLTPDKAAQYSGLFERQPLQGTMLPGEQARQIFDKSGLPNEALGKIWELSDTEQRGALAQAEFIIAMHLLTSLRTGSLSALPKNLPPALYEAATQSAAQRGFGAAPRQSPNNTGMSAIPRQMSGTAQPRTGSPLGRPPMTPQASGVVTDWAVTPADKARFDQIYIGLDKTNKGYITGEEAVPFFGESRLPEDALAQIWDLADFNSQGSLTREGFAVAMYLIRQQRSGQGPLPNALPSNLIPPAMRAQARPPPPANSAFDPPPMSQPPPPQPKSALDDLFGLDSGATSPVPAPAQTTMSTGGSNADPFAGGNSVLPPSSPIRASPTGNSFKPFIPSSSFGRGLSTQPTGNSSTSKHPPQPSASDDLLGEHDEASTKISAETTELANISSQIGTLSKQMQDNQAKRSTTQNELNQTNSQKQNFEQRLAQLRTLYEKEAKDTHALEEQLRNSRSDSKKLQGECMTLEGTYRDIQGQHQQVLASLQADQQENTNLRERIRIVNAEIVHLKPQIEKLKSEARQQKGLVAINKKQLSTTEGERDKLKTEAEEIVKSNEDISRQASTGSPASPSAQVVSPAASTASGNNPFFKRTASTDIMGVLASPPARTYSTDKSFDDVFGPSFPAGSTGTPPPPAAAFKPQTTGASSNSVGSFSTPPAGSPVLPRQTMLAAEPPAPPESRQISSSFLPFQESTESLSSSRQVSPPASRAEGSGSDATNPFPGDITPALERVETIPGAFPTGESETKDTPTGSPIPAGTPVMTPSESLTKTLEAEPVTSAAADPFGGDEQAKAKSDFDNAFAAFTTGKGKAVEAAPTSAPKTAPVFDSEFPPISELERDEEESDSNSEGGFDDDFAPASPQRKASLAKPSVISAFPEPSQAEATPPAVPSKEPEPADKSAEQPSSPATITNNSVNSIGQSTTVDDIFGSAATGAIPSIAQAAPSNPPAPPPKGAFDDDDDFEGLEDAKEGSADDDFANISRSGLDDFNPVFDSSPPASQTKTDSTAFGNESSFDFVSSNSITGGPAPASGNQQTGADSHDWDAIFAGLDSTGTAAPAPPPLSNPAVPAAPPAPASPDSDGLLRPTGPGRALTTEGVHDDPILKNLTGMGYTRTDALMALEKYDYNLERAANYLASQS